MALPSGPSGRVVITGLGTINALGNSVAEFWPRLIAGESGIGEITLMETSEYPTRIAGEVKGFDAGEYVDKKEARRIDRFMAFSVAASKMALDDAGFPLDDKDVCTETGVLIGSGIGGLTTMSEQARKLFSEGPGRVSPFLVPYMIPDMGSGYVSIVFGLRGPNTCSVTACASAANAIGDAYHIIKRGDAVAMVAGGSEAPINPIGLSGFCSARAMTTNNEAGAKASRPFDANRDGFVMSEGAGVFILEDLEFAKTRGAKIYAEVIGYGMSGDAYHITSPDQEGDGAYRSMRMAIKNSGLRNEDIDYINAHGTSTPYNDKFETLAYKKTFGDLAYKIPISSTKSALGHSLGATGAVESLICVMAMREGVIPPTINYETPDPECDLDIVPNTARKADLKVSLTNSFGFGGHNATLMFRKWEE